MNLLYEHESYEIRGACFWVWKEFGSAFKESIVEGAMSIELRKRGLQIERQKRVDIYYYNQKVGTYIPDIVVNDSILVELKAKPFISKQDIKQFWHYLRGTKYKLGFLINFGEKLEIERIVYDEYKIREKIRVTGPREDSPTLGFTLIELIVSVAGFTIILLGVVSLMSSMFTVNRQQGGLLADQDQARKLVYSAMSELRNSVSSNVGAYALVEAGSQQLTFYSNIDGGLDVERVRYFSQNGELKKGVVKPTGNPLTYNFGTETVTTVQKNLANGTNPVFYYYNDTYTGATDNYLAQPVNVTSVKLVKVSLDIFNKAGVKNINTYKVTAIGTIRGLKTNLGN